MVYFDPSSVIPKPGEIHIIIDELIVDTKKIDFDSVIVIPPSPERLEINYAAASLNNSKEIRFKYIMNGMERQWVDAADNMKATYTQLPYGQYTFRVKAYTKDNETNYAETFFSIYIKPNFWETPWFNAGVILLAFSTVGGSIRLFYKSKYKRKLERLQAQHALEKERIRISKDMHDELGSSLTKMSLLSEIAKKFSNNPETIRKYLADISETGRNVANTMDEIVWAVNPRNDRLDKTIYYIAQFVEEYLAIAGVNLNLQLPDFIPDYFLSAEQRHNLFMVIKEAVNNIVKHSKAKNVEFTIVTSRDDLEIKIKDDGAGIDFEKIGEFSNGLSNMKKRITDINGIITISNIKPSGVLLGIKISHKSVM
jgi:signal transduction histidine kinase